jgi:hypothetical protein
MVAEEVGITQLVVAKNAEKTFPRSFGRRCCIRKCEDAAK